MIKTSPQIEIDQRGRWFHKGNEIINDDILTYFKANLERDTSGYFIRNKFGEREELAFLDSVKGFPLFVEVCEIQNDSETLQLSLRLDSGQSYTIPATDLYLFAEDCLAVYIIERNLFARLSSSAMAGLADYLYEHDQNKFSISWPDVDLETDIKHASMQSILHES